MPFFGSLRITVFFIKRKRVCGGIYNMYNDNCIITMFRNHLKHLMTEGDEENVSLP